MDTRLLRHYETELAFIREMGAEFAEAYPKIAARLGIEGMEVLDPYVERLYEGFAFLAARVQLELEMQYPVFTSHLLEIIYPHYLAPTPSMAVIHLEPDDALSAMAEGYHMPRHTPVRSRVVEGGQTACQFRTAHETTLWPLKIVETEYIDSRGALIAAGFARDIEARAGVRLRLKRMGAGPLAELTADALTLFLQAQNGGNWILHEVMSTQVTGLAARSTDRRADWRLELDAAEVRPKGYAADEALLETPAQTFDGYRLLQEYFAMPERFHFVELAGLAPAFKKAAGDEVDIYLFLREGHPEMGDHLRPASFSLHAVPIVNLFHRRCDRVPVTGRDFDHHVVVDRTAVLDFEVVRIEKVTGISGEGEDDIPFSAFYSQTEFTAIGEDHPAYYTVRRRMRQRSERERLRGTRTSYLGAELYLNLVDRNEAPYPAHLDQLEVEALCTNRDLPLLLATGAPDMFHLPGGGPVKTIETPIVPTRPRPTLSESGSAWRLLSHLSLNYLSIADTTFGGSAEALRELVGLYAPPEDRALQKQLEGLVQVSSRPIVRRMPDEVLSTAVRGLEIALEMDESFFEGTSVYTLGSVLERFFAKYAAINSFTETVLRTQQRGEVCRWDATRGLRQIA